MTRTTRWFLGSAALALALAAAPAQATDTWAPPSFTFEAAEPHWLDAGVTLQAADAADAAPAAQAAPQEADHWKTEPSRYLGSPIYGRGIVTSE
jgi:hypothetical protein